MKIDWLRLLVVAVIVVFIAAVLSLLLSLVGITEDQMGSLALVIHFAVGYFTGTILMLLTIEYWMPDRY